MHGWSSGGGWHVCGWQQIRVHMVVWVLCPYECHNVDVRRCFQISQCCCKRQCLLHLISCGLGWGCNDQSGCEKGPNYARAALVSMLAYIDVASLVARRVPRGNKVLSSVSLTAKESLNLEG